MKILYNIGLVTSVILLVFVLFDIMNSRFILLPFLSLVSGGLLYFKYFVNKKDG
jgi:uncharacterized membrane protein (UPF0136 family)